MNHATEFIEHLKPRKISICIFNRATYSRVKSLIDEFEKYPNITLEIVLGSSADHDAYGRPADYIEKNHTGLKFFHILAKAPNGSHFETSLYSRHVFYSCGLHWYESKPDAVIVVADRFETLPAAMTASYMNIPLIHIQGGEITGNIDDKVRHAVTMLSDYHFACTWAAKDYLLAMGQEYKRIFFTGCPSLDLILKNRIKRNDPKEKYVLCIFHPETENSDQAYEQTKIVFGATLEYCRQYGYRCYWYYPNIDPGTREITRFLNESIKENSAFIIKAINLEPEAFLHQLSGARVIIGNSSCGIRESSRLGVPSVNIGERQRLRERSINVIDAGYVHDEILSAIKKQHDIRRYQKSRLYGEGLSAKRIAEVIARLDLSIKGPLTYPFQPKYKDNHFGELRLLRNEKKRRRYGPNKEEPSLHTGT